MRLAPVFLLGLACSSSPGPVDAGLSEAEVKAKYAACEFKKGALPADTVPRGTPLGAQLPFEHIVLVMQENRSFDHYFSKLSHGGVRVAPSDATNPDPAGNPIARYHETKYCIRDVSHSWRNSHIQYADGGMSGFVITNEPDGGRAMGWYDETDLPFYYALSRTFAISDAHFSSVMGPTQPNRWYYFAATSFGFIQNTLPPEKAVTLFDRLDAARVDWRSYSTDVASPAVFTSLLSKDLEKFEKVDAFFTAAATGTLPPVSFVEGSFNVGVPNGQSDEHPPANPQQGQRFVARVVDAVMKGPKWSKTVLIITYDEHGGFYDSVPPPQNACEPDELRPMGDDARRFDHYGFRTPLIVVSPFARRGYVSHEPVDHTAVTRFVELRFGLPALTARDANMWPLLDMFDFTKPDTSVPQLPEAVVDAAKDAECAASFP